MECCLRLEGCGLVICPLQQNFKSCHGIFMAFINMSTSELCDFGTRLVAVVVNVYCGSLQMFVTNKSEVVRSG